jgi:hypothetical protein
MPLTALALETRLLDEITDGDSDRFRELLSEVDERLLEMGKWQWTRGPIDLTPVDGIVELPEGYSSIVGCKIGSMAAGVLWQEIEYLEGGPGIIPVEGINGQLLDLGLIEGVRTYRCTGSNPEEIVVLARFAPLPIVENDDSPRCQSFSAIKQGLMALVAESVNDLERSRMLMKMAIETLDFQEQSYRGSARKIFDPKIYGPPRRRNNHNFP